MTVDRARGVERLKAAVRSHAFWAVVIAVIVFIVGVPPVQDARLTPDSGSYLGLSSARMPVYPLIASTLENGYAIVFFQYLLSLCAWSWLGWVVGRAPGVLLASMFAISGPIVMWDMAVLSESVCLSLLAASLAATIILYRRWSRDRFVLWVVALTLFALTRTTNMFLVPFLALPFAVKGRKQLLWAASAALIVCLIADVYSRTAGASLRKLSLVNVYTGRILLKPDRRDFFAERGMPLRAEMEPFVGKTGRKNARALFKACPEFSAWFDASGASTYYKYLVAVPRNFKWPVHSVVHNVNYMDFGYVEGTVAKYVHYYLLYYYVVFFLPWWIWIAGLLLPLLSRRLLGRVTPESLFVPALMIGAYAYAYANYHGDKAELSRHIIPTLVLYKVTAVLMVVAAATTIVEWRRQRSTVRPAAPAAGGQPSRGRRKKGKGKRSR
jgi:hypothetical protein